MVKSRHPKPPKPSGDADYIIPFGQSHIAQAAEPSFETSTLCVITYGRGVCWAVRPQGPLRLVIWIVVFGGYALVNVVEDASPDELSYPHSRRIMSVEAVRRRSCGVNVSRPKCSLFPKA